MGERGLRRYLSAYSFSHFLFSLISKPVRRFFRIVLLGADALLVVLFLVGYVARYVHPRHTWWAELVAVGLPYLSAGIVVAALAAAGARRWRLLGGHLVLVVLVAVRFAGPLTVSEPEPRPGDLTLMTFNVPRWGYDLQQKTQNLEALVARAQPDLISLQEAPVRYAPRRTRPREEAAYLEGLIDSMGYQVAAVAGPSFRTELPVLSRFPLEGQQNLVRRPGALLSAPVVDQELPRSLQIVRVLFEWQGREAVLYNLHLRSFGAKKPWREAEREPPLSWSFWEQYLRQYREAYQVRAWEVEQVRALIDKETRPVLVTGDFNSTPHSWVYRQLADGMQDAFHVAGSGWGATYHTRLPFARIDFVLASPEWEVVSAEVPDVWLSDHLPVLARLRWRDEG